MLLSAAINEPLVDFRWAIEHELSDFLS
jgi:hypothetical protein